MPTLAIVGVGLMGGSVALAARRRGIVDHILGVDQQPAVLAGACRAGILDEACPDLTDAAGQADILVFCTPVNLIPTQVLAAAPACRPGALLTDVGSTKAGIVQALQDRLPSGIAFVGSHPLAGSDRQGYEHADGRLFENRLVLVTPTARTEAAAVDRTVRFWQALGATVQLMDAEEHDRGVALTSHLPHLVSSALAGILPRELLPLTAGGFRDTTRLAGASPALWRSIFQANLPAVLGALDRLENQLQRFRQALADQDMDALEALLEQGKQVRDALPRGQE
jgi:prephenate dehydrogenase